MISINSIEQIKMDDVFFLPETIFMKVDGLPPADVTITNGI